MQLHSSFQAVLSSEKIAPHRQGRNVDYVIGESSPCVLKQLRLKCVCMHVYTRERAERQMDRQVKVVQHI